MRAIRVTLVLFIMALTSLNTLAAKPAVDPADNPERTCNADANVQELSVSERKAFMKQCLEENGASDTSKEDSKQASSDNDGEDKSSR